jgi:DNA-binding MarR family transcriptional regulator
MSDRLNTAFTDDAERRTFRALGGILSIFRKVDGDMAVQQMIVFYWVVMNEGGSQREMCVDLDMPNSTASRNIAALSLVHRLGKEGLGLVTWTDDLMDRRVKRLVLTPKGRTFARSLLQTL